jgi:hypothetical protein
MTDLLLTTLVWRDVSDVNGGASYICRLRSHGLTAPVTGFPNGRRHSRRRQRRADKQYNAGPSDSNLQPASYR